MIGRKFGSIAMICFLALLPLFYTIGCGRRSTGIGGSKGSVKSAVDLYLFVPCGMIEPFFVLKRQFTKRTGKRINIHFNNAVVLLRKIRRGERPDILVTPGELEMRMMIDEGYIDPKSVRTFGTFHMVLVVPKENRARVRTLADLAKPSIKHVAIAEPSLNSAGFYAKKILENAGLWDKVERKLVTHWHALEAAAFVCKGRVDVGIYYATCPFKSGPQKLKEVGVREQQPYRIVYTIPQKLYPPVKVQAGILKEAGHKQLAKQFIEFMLEPETQKLLAEKGIPNFNSSE